MEKGIDAALDYFEIVADPGFEIGTSDGNAQIDIGQVRMIAEAEFGNFSVGQRKFYMLHRLVKLITEIFIDD